jgi:hypothetical protein
MTKTQVQPSIDDQIFVFFKSMHPAQKIVLVILGLLITDYTAKLISTSAENTFSLAKNTSLTLLIIFPALLFVNHDPHKKIWSLTKSVLECLTGVAAFFFMAVFVPSMVVEVHFFSAIIVPAAAALVLTFPFIILCCLRTNEK